MKTLNTLSARYMENANVKNPILNFEVLTGYMIDFAEHGPRWDGPSCLVVSYQGPFNQPRD
jgi:hypothetical protein